MSNLGLRGMIPQAALLIGAFVAFISAGIFAMPFVAAPQADMHIEPGIGKMTIWRYIHYQCSGECRDSSECVQGGSTL